eukprot:1145694-Pelagomonas_calceolata.AAC.1
MHACKEGCWCDSAVAGATANAHRWLPGVQQMERKGKERKGLDSAPAYVGSKCAGALFAKVLCSSSSSFSFLVQLVANLVHRITKKGSPC